VSLEVHLMVKDVRLAIEQWNYPWVKKIIFHFESGMSTQTGCRQIRSLGKLPGIAIAPQTPVESVLSSLSDVDTILVMTVEPGRNGAEFLPQMLDKVRMLRAVSPRLNIEVDGGVNLDTLKSCAAAGANLFVVGIYLKNEEFGIRLKALTQILR
jgi:ribulose-phosphate 3-epimerase